ncbi:3-keto-disaccharide hydrolase [Rosistilla oblonga]|uniref:3-keto-alpha-glucoside-1,2-lyase/3-keto-2-hydroxy-glucal hydratase domain-containing protein n=1 Tax=Rosistilla oblonga TaxID=2527990 RepID=A0A518IRK7_9BACT|nr:DUF1080 domain-containing protein [Rosistilla oblonga]QDV55683.1 hypothetical protein Mal33_16620 [Rosistilla oblonga]
MRYSPLRSVASLPRLALFACIFSLSAALAVADESANGGWIDLKLQRDTVWEPCNFGGDGEVEFSENQAVLEMGDPLTGIRLVKEFPKDGYEIQFEASRLEGFDFFVGLTFPVAESHCSLILGGWSGAVIGLSNINGADASNNPTTREGDFDNNRWYRVRVRVAADRITAWVDDKQWVDQPRQGVEFGIRGEMDPSTPLGIATYQCKVAYRKIQYRRLNSGEVKPSHKPQPTESKSK